MNNFIYQLVDYLKEQDWGYPVHLGPWAEGEALVVFPTSDSSKVHGYMDGRSELRLSFHINIQAQSQAKGLATLTDVLEGIHHIRDFLRDRAGEDTLVGVEVAQWPYVANEQATGYFNYHSTIEVTLITNK